MSSKRHETFGGLVLDRKARDSDGEIVNLWGLVLDALFQPIYRLLVASIRLAAELDFNIQQHFVRPELHVQQVADALACGNNCIVTTNFTKAMALFDARAA